MARHALRRARVYVVADGHRYQLVIELPRVRLREVVRSAGVFALLLPFGVLAAGGISWVVWLGHDDVAYHLSAVTR